MAYRYGPTAVRAGARIARWGYKRYRSGRRRGRMAKRRRVARFDRKFLGQTRHRHYQSGDASVSTLVPGTWDQVNLAGVPRGTGKNEVERGKYIIKGIKLCGMFKNENTEHAMYCRWILASPAYPASVTQDSTFFSTSNVDNGARTASFNNLGGITNGPQRLRYCTPVNSGFWKIKAGGKFILSKKEANEEFHKAERVMERYIKLNMPVEQQDASVPQDQSKKLYLLTWVENLSNVPNTPVQYEWNCTTYFKQGN